MPILLLLPLMKSFLVVSLQEALDLGPPSPHLFLILCGEFEDMLHRAALRGLVRLPVKHRDALGVRFSEGAAVLINLGHSLTFEFLHVVQEPLLLVHQVKHGIVVELVAILKERPREQVTRVDLLTAVL
jgi:hypothetical protein